MKILAPANHKGGVGKTKTATQFAQYAAVVLAEKGIINKRVLLIDFDPQTNASQQFLKMETDPSSPEGFMPPIHPDYSSDDDSWNGRSSIADIFYPELGTQGIRPYPTYLPNLDICPAHSSRLETARQVRKSEVAELILNRLKLFLDQDDVKEEYDLVVIDTSPSKCPLTTCALKAATHMVIPCVMEDKSIKGVFGMLQFWLQQNENRDELNKLELIGIFANMYDARTSLHTQHYEALSKTPGISKYLLNEKLSRRIAFAEVDSDSACPKSIFNYPDSDKAKQEALSLYEIIAKRMFNYV